MSEKIIPDSIDNAIDNVTGKVTETAGDLLDAALTYAGRNIIKRYKFSKADDDFQLAAYKQAQDQALELQRIKNERIKQFYGDYIEKNIKRIAEKTLNLANRIPDEERINPNIDLIGQIFEESKYKEDENLVELFSNLLVSSVDICRCNYIHPSFSHIISEMSSLDAENMNIYIEKQANELPIAKIYVEITSLDDNEKEQILNGIFEWDVQHVFGANKKCKDYKALSSSITILEKRGLITLDYDSAFTDLNTIYEKNEDYAFLKYFTEWEFQQNAHFTYKLLIKRGFARLTDYGKIFLVSCIERDKTEYLLKGLKEQFSFSDLRLFNDHHKQNGFNMRVKKIVFNDESEE